MISERGRVAGGSAGSQQPEWVALTGTSTGWHAVPPAQPARTSGRQERTEADLHPDTGSKTQRAPPRLATSSRAQRGAGARRQGTAHWDSPAASPAVPSVQGTDSSRARRVVELPASCPRPAGGRGAGEDGQRHNAHAARKVTQMPAFPRRPPASALLLASCLGLLRFFPVAQEDNKALPARELGTKPPLQGG